MEGNPSVASCLPPRQCQCSPQLLPFCFWEEWSCRKGADGDSQAPASTGRDGHPPTALLTRGPDGSYFPSCSSGPAPSAANGHRLACPSGDSKVVELGTRHTAKATRRCRDQSPASQESWHCGASSAAALLPRPPPAEENAALFLIIRFKILKDAYVLQRIDGNPAQSQLLKIALSRSTAARQPPTGTLGPAGTVLSAPSISITASGPQHSGGSASMEIYILHAGKK